VARGFPVTVTVTVTGLSPLVVLGSPAPPIALAFVPGKLGDLDDERPAIAIADIDRGQPRMTLRGGAAGGLEAERRIGSPVAHRPQHVFERADAGCQQLIHLGMPLQRPLILGVLAAPAGLVSDRHLNSI
jgi:hypothetical protein